MRGHTSYRKSLQKFRKKALEEVKEKPVVKEGLMSFRQQQAKENSRSSNSLQYIEDWFRSMKNLRESFKKDE